MTKTDWPTDDYADDDPDDDGGIIKSDNDNGQDWRDVAAAMGKHWSDWDLGLSHG